jgi:hypothetical protein
VTIAKGSAWGFASLLPEGAPIVGTDRELAQLLAEGVASAVPAVVGIEGGAIWEMLGGETLRGRLRTKDAFTYPIDLGVVESNGDRRFFVNHVLARSRFWTTGFAILNGQTARGLRLGHRSHPNDGVLDATRWELRLGELRQVRNRARYGAHTPHPRITEKRAKTHEMALERRILLEIDGHRANDEFSRCGAVCELRFSIIADAGFVVA